MRPQHHIPDPMTTPMTPLMTKCLAAPATVLLLTLAACKPTQPPAPPAEPAVAEPAAPVAVYKIGALTISEARTRETPPNGTTTAGFLTIRNDGSEPDRLLGASATAAAASVELHEMSSTADGVMQMRALPDGLTIAPGSEVALAPGGVHLMLIGLNQTLVAGQTLPVELSFEKAGKLTVPLAIKAFAPL